MKIDLTNCKTPEDVERAMKPLGVVMTALREELGPPCTCRIRTKKLGWWHADECPRFVPRRGGR